MFAASKIFWWVASPGNLIVAALTIGIIARVCGLRRLGGGLIAIGALSCLILTVTPVQSWILAPLENRFPQIDAPAHVDGVVVLGGAIDTARTASRGRPAVNESAERLFALVDLARRYPAAKVVYSGGSASIVDDEVREADIARNVFTSLGLAEDRVIYERNSRNTYENAVLSQPLAMPKPGETWLLVTSAYHMPRAVGVFRAIGWPVTAYPVDYGGGPNENQPPFSFLDGLSGVNWAIREWIGLVFYRLSERTDSLFPGPAQ
jgi:uncharacterized SAM-binding protein YcdF (DUF218 family)